jgi:hypothetical protein
MQTFALKRKVMAFKGQVPVRTKIVIGNTILKQVDMLIYLGRTTSYEEEKGTTSKIIRKFSHISGILNNVSRPNVVQE